LELKKRETREAAGKAVNRKPFPQIHFEQSHFEAGVSVQEKSISKDSTYIQ
jgi:hypothetical protein